MSESQYKAKRAPRKIRATHFHCYLLRSLDPSHPQKTYIGFTTNPHRRLREHNGILKNGGARKTRRSGRPWQFVLVVHGFPDQVSALQFEWAWQNPGKSLHVRNAIGEPDATVLSRKRGIRAQLHVLRTLLSDCDEFTKYPLKLYFLEQKWMDEFVNLKLKHYQENAIIETGPLPEHMTHQVLPIEQMPFWEDSRKKKGNKSRQDQSSNEKEHSKQKPRREQSCFLCTRSIIEKEYPITCTECVNVFHEFCLEDQIESRKTGTSSPVQCPSCHVDLNWIPETSTSSENEMSISEDLNELTISDCSLEESQGFNSADTIQSTRNVATDSVRDDVDQSLETELPVDSRWCEKYGLSSDDSMSTNEGGNTATMSRGETVKKTSGSSDWGSDESGSSESELSKKSTLRQIFEVSSDESPGNCGIDNLQRDELFTNTGTKKGHDATSVGATSGQKTVRSKSPIFVDLITPEPQKPRCQNHVNNHHIAIIDLCESPVE